MITLKTLPLLLPTVGNCLCGAPLANDQEITDGLCPACADAPAVAMVRPDVIAAFAIAQEKGSDFGGEIAAMTATVEAWNACPDKEAFFEEKPAPSPAAVAERRLRHFVKHRNVWHEYQGGTTLCGKVVGLMPGVITPFSDTDDHLVTGKRCSVCFPSTQL